MEYFGKILCISANDLTYDDRPLINEDGTEDWTQSRVLDGKSPKTLSPEILAPIMSEPNYKQLSSRKKINVVRPGKGLGNYALVELATLPQRFKDHIKLKYGDMKSDILKDWLSSHFCIDSKARSWYTRFRFENSSSLPPEKINEYTINASVLQAVLGLMNDTKIIRKAMQGNKVNWGEMVGAISYYQTEFGHTLPLSPNRFQRKVEEFKSVGYECLISRKFSNQNKRKVSVMVEQLVLSLSVLATNPYTTVVAEMYNDFVLGKIEVADPETGECFDPEDFKNKKGDPIVLSEKTIYNILNNPKNKALRAKMMQDSWEFNNNYRPYHLRHSGQFSLSKISLDDRDLPRPMHDGNRVKAYYAYDVTSGCVVGYAYNKLKVAELFLDCMRNMFQTLDRNGMYMPAELEVEHHLVDNFGDGLMKAGVVFPLIRWCNPGNSKEKRAEHFNRAKKYGVEKNLQQNIGRWYARLESNRSNRTKVYDEYNDTYKEKSYSYDELVSDDIRAIDEYNHMKHPNQKLYPGMTRWDVLCKMQNPDLQPWDKPYLYRYIGEWTDTSIRQNTYCTVQYKQYRLPSPEDIAKLAPHNLKVRAFYLPDIDGNINEVYIWQDDKFIATCGLIERYNEATAEQTEADREAYTEQAKYVSQFDKMIKDGKIKRVAVSPKAESHEISKLEAKEVKVIEVMDDDDDLSEYMDASKYKGVGSSMV
ncbi:MAG: hypothetical protein LKE54_08320 [Prevotella sp.]|jgi:hypothetical protein|nr:hypothetical protein [Prevotella sp.]MCH3995036.1 hypothetical protein [Prevotella sp.]